MTPLEELPEEMPKEAPQTDCESVKKEWDAASKTGRVSAELMQKALECKLVPEDKVKGMPTGEKSMPPAPSRDENPLIGEDKELGMAELYMATAEELLEDLRSGDTTISEAIANEGYAEGDRPAEGYGEAPAGYTSPGGYWTTDSDGNWNFTGETGYDSFTDSFVGTGSKYTPPTPPTVNVWGMDMSYIPTDTQKIPINIKDNEGIIHTLYVSEQQMKDNSEFFSKFDQGSAGGGGGGRIMNTINPNYFSGQAPQKPSDMGNMEWYYRYGGGMYQNAFNPESFYFNPDDKGNAGQSSSPYSRIGNRGNMTPEIVQSNKPFYDERGINKYTNLDELKFKQRTMNMAEVAMPQGQENPMGASVDQTQGRSQEIDEQVQEQLKEAIMEAGFNVVDIGMSPEGKILITVGQFEDSYIENAQYFEVDFELAEPMKCGKRFKAIAVTPGMYKAKDGTLVELSSEQLQNIAGLFRNKPLVLVDHDLARPDSTHEGRNVGYIEDSWYDGDYDAVIYKGALTEDLDLAMIAGSSIKLSHGKTPMGRHIALIPKCIPGRACYAPQDPNAVILENAQKIGEDKMNINPQQAAALKKELEHINKQKESMIDGIIKSEIEAGQLKSNIFDRTRELWKSDVGVLLEMASAKTETKDIPSTKSKDEGKKELSLAKKIEKGEIDPEDALVFLIENDPFFKA